MTKISKPVGCEFDQYGKYGVIRSNIAEIIAAFYWNCSTNDSKLIQQLLLKKMAV